MSEVREHMRSFITYFSPSSTECTSFAFFWACPFGGGVRVTLPAPTVCQSNLKVVLPLPVWNWSLNDHQLWRRLLDVGDLVQSLWGEKATHSWGFSFPSPRLCQCHGVECFSGGRWDQPATKLLMQPKATWEGSENKRHHSCEVISGKWRMGWEGAPRTQGCGAGGRPCLDGEGQRRLPLSMPGLGGFLTEANGTDR